MRARLANHNLPALLTRFIGREPEVAAAQCLLATHRLVTLTGPGGVGKSRLALRLADAHRDRTLDGVWLVELAPLADPAVVPSAVLAALRLREEPAVSPVETLCRSLADRHLLLLLDNCEHLLDACAALAARLLAACPHLTLLATSRVPLGVDGEVLYAVPPLSLPADTETDAETLLQSDAVSLFAERAPLGWPEFRVSAENAGSVAAICRRLEGLPLAIELAVARVGTLSVSEIAARLSDRFRLLTGGGRTAPARQQTLRASLDWSYELLSGEEQELLSRLSVFAGGFSGEAAEAVCGEGLADVPAGVRSLVRQSLVRVEAAGEDLRYGMLETIREYARERLEAAGEVDEVRRRHRDCFLGLAEQVAGEMKGERSNERLERLDREHDNLRAALGGCIAAREVTEGLRLALALEPFWSTRLLWREGQQFLMALLALTDPSDRTEARVQAVRAAAVMAWWRSDSDTCRALNRELLAMSREREDGRQIAATLRALAHLELDQCGGVDAARRLYEESLVHFRALGDLPGVGATYYSLGVCERESGNIAGTCAAWEESLAVWRQVGEAEGVIQSLWPLALLAYAAAAGISILVPCANWRRSRPSEGTTHERTCCSGRASRGPRRSAFAWGWPAPLPTGATWRRRREILPRRGAFSKRVSRGIAHSAWSGN